MTLERHDGVVSDQREEQRHGDGARAAQFQRLAGAAGRTPRPRSSCARSSRAGTSCSCAIASTKGSATRSPPSTAQRRYGHVGPRAGEPAQRADDQEAAVGRRSAASTARAAWTRRLHAPAQSATPSTSRTTTGSSDRARARSDPTLFQIDESGAISITSTGRNRMDPVVPDVPPPPLLPAAHAPRTAGRARSTCGATRSFGGSKPAFFKAGVKFTRTSRDTGVSQSTYDIGSLNWTAAQSADADRAADSPIRCRSSRCPTCGSISTG